MTIWNFSNFSTHHRSWLETFRWLLFDLKLSDKTWSEMCYLKLFKNPSWELLIWNFQVWKRGAIWNFWNLKLFKPIMGGLLIWKFQMRLEKEVLFEMFETWNFSNMSWGVALFETFRWDLKWDVLFETFLPFQTHHKSCLFETFRWLETRYAIWNVWNLKLFKHVMGVAYLKLSDETWSEMCLKWDVIRLFETFQTFQPITGVGYLKLSDKTWNEMCYLKVFNLFKPIMRADYLKLSGETWKRGAIWNFWNFKHFKPIMGGLLIWNFQMRLEMRCAIWNFLTFSNPSWELIIWNFQMRLETRYAIWNFWNLKLFKPMSWEIAYLKVSDETWKRGAIWNVWNLKLFKPIMGGCFFETFR